jgi:hypothetical protein
MNVQTPTHHAAPEQRNTQKGRWIEIQRPLERLPGEDSNLEPSG